MKQQKIILIVAAAATILLLVFVLWLRKKIRIYRLRRRKKQLTDAAGARGEQELLEAVQALPGRKRILTNLYIPRRNGTTTEIDLVMVCRKGIFVMEAKNMSGFLSGDDTSKNWMHVSPRNSFAFYNPILQNRSHVHALMDVLKVEEDTMFHSWIVLNEVCGMRDLTLRQDTYKVLRRSQLKKQFRRTRGVNLKKDDIEEIYRRFLPYTKATHRTKKKHVQEVSRRR